MIQNARDILIGTYVGTIFKTSLPQIPSCYAWQFGDQIYNTSPSAGGSMGWVCTTAGIANANSWASSTAYHVGDIVNSNGNVYVCITAATSGATAPNGTSDNISDGGAVWDYAGPLAAFHEFGLISST